MKQQLLSVPNSGNLPRPSTAFIGRQGDLEAISARYSEPTCRLLTVVGPGGIGKTRLALEAARRMETQVRDGAWFVELDSLHDPSLVPQAVASALGLRDLPDRTLVESLGDHLRSKQMLLLLDNCEHLLDACASLARGLLATCPQLLILATSREPLHIPGETIWPVEPLCLPPLDPLPSVQDLLECEAIELFVERAQRVFPAFSIIPENALDVAQICHRLDGLPLAIELAAPWVKVLSVAQMAQRLDDRLQLLTSTDQHAPARHQTLLAALDWSYELLSDEERTLLLRLAIFAGSFGLEAAEAICAGDKLDEARILELLSHLVDKSLVLVVTERGRPRRYRLLDTVRQYAWQQYHSPGDWRTLGDRHLQWYLRLAEELEPYLWGTAEADRLHRLAQEEGNMRAALQWSISNARLEEGLRLASALGWYWYVQAHFLEGQTWLERMLASGHGDSNLSRAMALKLAGALALQQQDPEQATSFLENGFALVKDRGPTVMEGWFLQSLGLASLQGWFLQSLGLASLQDGRYVVAEQQFDQARALFEEALDEAGTATVLLYQGLLACHQENYALAEVRLNESAPLLRQLGDAVGLARALLGLGLVARYAADLERARALCMEALKIAWEQRARLEIAQVIEMLAGVAGDQGLAQRAARLLGAASTLRESIGAGPPKGTGLDLSHDLDALRAQLGDTTFQAAWEAGRSMGLDQLRQYAESEDGAVAAGALPGRTELHPSRLTPLQAEKHRYQGLTRRERQVAALVARGLSNKEIAGELVVTVRTVESHITNILGKLGFSSRTQIATWAVDKGLASPPRTLADRMGQE